MYFDIVSDLHSCFDEFTELLTKLGYKWNKGFSFYHPDDRKVVLVGDITDRGWHPAPVIQLVENMISDGSLLMVKGNHDDKLQRYAKGNNVSLLHGLDGTIEKINQVNISKERILNLFSKIPYFLSLDKGKLIIVHAAWKDEYIDRDPFDKKLRSWCIFGPTTGKITNGLPERIDWAASRTVDSKSPIIIHGHQPVKEIRIVNRVWNIDTGCVFGGKLSCVRYPEMEIVQVPAKQTYCNRESRWG